MKQAIFIFALLMGTVLNAQTTTNTNTVIARQNFRFSGQSPDTNKIAVSMDILGNMKWVYFSSYFQDSTVNYDTTNVNVLNANTVKVNRDSFTDPAATIASIGDSGFIVQCAASCDDIRWTTIDGTQTVLKDITDNVGIGTSSPNSKLEINGDVTIIDVGVDSRIGTFVIDSFKLDIGITNQAGDTSLVFSYAPVGTSNTNLNIQTQGGHIVLQEVNNNVGIGTSTPTEKLHVAGTSLFTDTLTYQNGTQADGYVLTSDANGNATWQAIATWQDHTAYGEMGFGDSSRTIAITQNVFSVVTNSNNTLWSTAAIDLHNVTYSGDSLIIDSAGVYQVNVQLSMDGTSGSVIRLGVFLNGVLACSCTGYQELLNNRILQLTYINIDALNAGDVLQVVITNTANGDDVDAIGGKLMVNKIR